MPVKQLENSKFDLTLWLISATSSIEPVAFIARGAVFHLESEAKYFATRPCSLSSPWTG